MQDKDKGEAALPGRAVAGQPPFFNQEAAQSYDQRNAGLKPISDNLHFLVRLVLADLPAHARVLCVGVGTGAEFI